jgi:sugar fermentation stimulation protein A
MRFEDPPVRGTLLKRYKRFLADVELEDGSMLTAHCPNTGSLLGCKEPGSAVLLRDSKDPKRKLRFTWQAIKVGRTWVNVDTNLPNRVVAEALEAGEVPGLTGYDRVRREVKYGKNSRIDVLLEADDGRSCYVEVKSTTLAEGKFGLFPDAVTERGRKHLGELADVVRAGGRAVQFFLVGRSDVTAFRPADHIDEKYGIALREAAEVGVELMAYDTKVGTRTCELGSPLPIELPERTPAE